MSTPTLCAADTELTVEYADGRLVRTSVSPERLNATLRELDVVLDSDELDALVARCK